LPTRCKRKGEKEKRGEGRDGERIIAIIVHSTLERGRGKIPLLPCLSEEMKKKERGGEG